MHILYQCVVQIHLCNTLIIWDLYTIFIRMTAARTADRKRFNTILRRKGRRHRRLGVGRAFFYRMDCLRDCRSLTGGNYLGYRSAIKRDMKWRSNLEFHYSRKGTLGFLHGIERPGGDEVHEGDARCSDKEEFYWNTGRNPALAKAWESLHF